MPGRGVCVTYPSLSGAWTGGGGGQQARGARASSPCWGMTTAPVAHISVVNVNTHH